MWSYFGSKSKIVGLYPPPKFDKIIEPFAGSARYSLKYWQKDVLLVDRYDVIVKLWKWLQQCSPDDILSLNKFIPAKGQRLNVDGFDCEEQRFLLGFIIQSAQGKPVSTLGTLEGIQPEKDLIRISKNLFKIKHWTIQQGNYHEIPNFPDVTWFIDPPYQFGGEHQYKFNNKQIEFSYLSEWCKNRTGQVIVCENTKADWMPFKPMVKNQGANNTGTTEAIWSNHITNYDNEQMSLFGGV